MSRKIVVWAACFMQHPMMVFRSDERAEAKAYVKAKKARRQEGARFWRIVRCEGVLPEKKQRKRRAGA